MTKDSLYQTNPYWSNLEYKKRNIPDYFLKRINHSGIFNQKNLYKPTVLSVVRDDSSYIIKTLFATAEKDNGFSRVSGIINVEAIKENGNWKLKSMLDQNLKKYQQYQAGKILYYFSKNRKLDTLLCNKFNEINTDIARKFDVSPMDIIYYLCTDNNELQRLIGFDYEISMAYPNQVSGLADIFNNTIYAGNNSEWYPHELVHLYVKDKFGFAVNYCFNEGIATYLGGSVGNSLQYHLHKIAVYVRNHSVDFTKLSSLERIDDETNFQYSIGGLICKIADERLGFEGINKLLQTGDSDEEMFQAIENTLGVKRGNFNEFIHTELKKYVN